MGQKVHPLGFRLGVTKTWSSRWIADRDYAKLLHEDLRIRDFIKKRLYHAGISRVELERVGGKLRITIHTARPGIVIGRRGGEVDRLRAELAQMTEQDVFVNIVEVRKPELDAQLVAEAIAGQLVRRVSFRRVMKKALATTMRLGAEGIKMKVSGRLGGAEIARSEGYREGRVPCHTLRADIDYGFAVARTTFGAIGVKVWIFKGEILPEKRGANRQARTAKAAAAS